MDNFIFDVNFEEDYGGCTWLLPHESHYWVEEMGKILVTNNLIVIDYLNVSICGKPQDFTLWACNVKSQFVPSSVCQCVSVSFVINGSTEILVFDRGKRNILHIRNKRKNLKAT